MVTNMTSCEEQEYEGETCRRHLKPLQDILENSSYDGGENASVTAIDISAAVDQQEQERIARQLNSGRNFVSITKPCERLLLPFACLYFFPLAACDKYKMVIRPTKNECIAVHKKCEKLLKKAKSLLGLQLPQCETFPGKEEQNNISLLMNYTRNLTGRYCNYYKHGGHYLYYLQEKMKILSRN